MSRITLTTLAVTAAALIAAPAALAAAPAITDPAGDATNASGRNVPAADVLSGTFSTDGAALTVAIRASSVSTSALATPATLNAAFTDVAGLPFTARTQGTSALLDIGAPSAGDGSYGQRLTGTLTRDTTTKTVTARFSLAAINSAIAATNGGPSLGLGSTLHNPFLQGISTGGFLGSNEAYDTNTTAASFTLSR